MKHQPKPWVKLYRAERGAFALLPLAARALAADMIKRADPDGTFYVGADGLEEVYARRFGATRSDRRMLRQCIPLLIDEGFIVRRGDFVVIKNYETAQSQGDGTVAIGEQDAGPSNDGAATVQRPSNEPTTTEQRPCNDRATKNESRPRNHSGPVFTQREEKRREEKISDLTRDPGAPGGTPEPAPVYRRQPDRFLAGRDGALREALAAVEAVYPRSEASGAAAPEFREAADLDHGGDVWALRDACLAVLTWKLAEFRGYSDATRIPTLRSWLKRRGYAEVQPKAPDRPKIKPGPTLAEWEAEQAARKAAWEARNAKGAA